ncbi:kinase-like domain-containing protein [Amanita rubescens]|nr:kinase-like domain-containing protein [Amanita rubescens]
MSDVEPLLDVILERLCNDSLVNLGVSDANQKARTLILKLITMTNVIPRSLFIVQVESEIGFGAISIGSVLKGKYRGRPVTLKVLSTGRYQESSRQIDLCKEAVTWKSVSHRFILPLLGIYEEKPLLFIVFPFMVNGTLTQWRRDRQRPDVAEIHRIMLEVATAVQYLHSEGVFHGDLNGDNILLDSGFHCQITNFGLSRHCFCQPECGEWHEQQRCKTMKMDVYAFGSLYYAIFFNTVQDSQTPGSVASRARPDRLRSPKMEDDTWNLIQSCWKSQPSERPTMEEIAKTLTQRPKTTRRISLITKISSRFLRL